MTSQIPTALFPLGCRRTRPDPIPTPGSGATTARGVQTTSRVTPSVSVVKSADAG